MASIFVSTPPATQPQYSLSEGVLPPSRTWLSCMKSAQEGLWLSHILNSPRLFISDLASAGSAELLTQYKIGAMLSLELQPWENVTLTTNPRSLLERYRVTQTNQAAYARLNLHRYYISLRDDDKNSRERMLSAFGLLQDICLRYRETGILVHCRAGNSRSVSLVAALIAKSEKSSFEQAVRYISECRGVGINERLATSITDALGIRLDQDPVSAPL